MDVPQQGQEKLCHQEGSNCINGQDPDIVCAIPAQAQQATFCTHAATHTISFHNKQKRGGKLNVERLRFQRRLELLVRHACI